MPVRLRLILSIIQTVFIFLLLGHTAYPQSARPTVSMRLRLSGWSNDNLIVGTETRTQTEPIQDLTGNTLFDIAITGDVSQSGSYSVDFLLDVVQHQETEFLRERNRLLRGSFIGTIGDRFHYGTKIEYGWNKFPNLSNANSRKIGLSSYLRFYLLKGLLGVLRYDYASSEFPNIGTGAAGYSLIKSKSHEFTFDVRKWLSDKIRFGLTYKFKGTKYASTESVYLIGLTGLGENEERFDNYFRVQPELTYVIRRNTLLNGGFKLINNNSNTKYYDYSGIGSFFDIIQRFNNSTSLSAGISYGLYSYDKRQFDSRFLNFKKDYRTTIMLTLLHNINDNILIEFSYRSNRNSSNDSINFNPTTSLTYSTYTQNVIAVDLEYSGKIFSF